MKRAYHNSVTKADPIRVAQLFAVQNFSSMDDVKFSERIVGLLRDRRFGDVKPLLDEFTRPELIDGFSYYSRKQFSAFLTKVPFAGDNKLRLASAKKSFWASEARCKRVNKKLSWYTARRDRLPDIIRVVLSRAAGEIRKVLGDLSEDKLGHIIQLSYPGRGVSVGTRNRFRVSLPYKLGDTDLASTDSALPYARLLVENSTSWLRLHAEVDWSELSYDIPYVKAEGNRVSFVPKDARTLRTIAIEPALNVALQLGVHSYMAKRLSEFGNAIDDQSVNQTLAKRGSLLDAGSSFATIDLSQASDSVSIELVRWLLPPIWFGLLDDLRSKVGTLDGSSFVYEKFSSMGNGFTFALETLIFWSLSRAVNSLTGGNTSSVYGDDIIVDDCSALLLTEVLEFVGFSVNRDKTYYHGPFRESCGADWHRGARVTPQYIRTAQLRSTDIYNLLNRMDPAFHKSEIRRYLLASIEVNEPVVRGLVNEDTQSCLFVPFSEMKEKRLLRWSSDWQTWIFRAWRFIPEQERPPVLSAYAASLFGGSRNGNTATLRGRGTFRLRAFTPGVTRDLPIWKVG